MNNASRSHTLRTTIDAAVALNQQLAAGTVSWAPYAEADVMPQMAGRSLVEVDAKTVSAA